MTDTTTLILRSVMTDSSVTVPYSDDLAAELLAVCEQRNDGNDVVEYCGTDDDGYEWRVHLSI